MLLPAKSRPSSPRRLEAREGSARRGARLPQTPDFGSSARSYALGECIGEGTYGKVFLAVEDQSGRRVVVKKMKRFEEECEGLQPCMVREVAFLKALSHPRVVRMQDFFMRKGALYVVFERCEMDLYQFYKRHKRRSCDSLVKRFSFELLEAMDYLHSFGMLHRDVKPQNVLITADRHVKLADFGLAKEVLTPLGGKGSRAKLTHQVVTLWYRAPEVLLGGRRHGQALFPYGQALDVWACGCVIAEMARGGEPLWAENSEIAMIMRIFRTIGRPSKHTWPDVVRLEHFRMQPWGNFLGRDLRPLLYAFALEPHGVDLVRAMLVLDPKQRLTAQQALKHPYFRGEVRCVRREQAFDYFLKRKPMEPLQDRRRRLRKVRSRLPRFSEAIREERALDGESKQAHTTLTDAFDKCLQVSDKENDGDCENRPREKGKGKGRGQSKKGEEKCPEKITRLHDTVLRRSLYDEDDRKNNKPHFVEKHPDILRDLPDFSDALQSAGWEL